MNRPIVDGLFVMSDRGLSRLLISKCNDCGALAFPSRIRCQACTGGNLTRAEAPGEGTVYSWTVVRELGGPLPDFEPYVVAQVDLAPGLRVQGLMDAGPGDVFIGQRVRTGVRRPPGPGLDVEVVTYCFVPLRGEAP